MLGNWMKILPYFMVEWLALTVCSKIDEVENGKRVVSTYNLFEGSFLSLVMKPKKNEQLL